MKQGWSWLWALGMIGVGLCACYQLYTTSTFASRIEVAGENLTGKSLLEAETILAEQLQHGQIIISCRDAKEFTFTYDNYFKCKCKSYLKRVLDRQKVEVDLLDFLTRAMREDLRMKLDLDAHNQALRVTYDKEHDVLLTEGQMTCINESVLREKLLAYFSGEQVTMKDTELLTWQAFMFDKDVEQVVKKQINRLLETAYHVVIGDQQVCFKGECILNWVTFNPAGQMYCKPNQIAQAITSWLDNKGATIYRFDFNTTLGQQKEVSWEVPVALSWDVVRGAEQLGNLLLTGYPEQIELMPRALTIGESYVEVDLKHQMLYCYLQGQLKLSSPIVSGAPITATQPGVYQISQLATNKQLRGVHPLTLLPYQQTVAYWISWNQGDQGIHDANWQTAFGGEIYLTQGSLGCINLPVTLMAKLYQLVYEGLPVIII